MLLRRVKERNGFGIVEVLISAAVLGFLYLALLDLELGNRQSVLRIRGRDGAVEVAQQVLDELQTAGAANIPSKPDADTTYKGPDYEREWDGGSRTILYSTEITVKPDEDYRSEHASSFMTVEHVCAKNVMVKVSWPFKGTNQSITISGVVR